MKRIFVSRPVDIANTNAQCLNAKAMLSRFNDNGNQWLALNYREPDPVVSKNKNVKLTRLWRKHLWYLHMVLSYQQRVDAIFYPGVQWMDYWGLWLRHKLGRKVPVIATMEGLVGDEKKISEWAGHPVYCQPVSPEVLKRISKILKGADHIVAISPFLAKIGTEMYGDKFSYIPLGIDLKTFYPSESENNPNKFRVICVGSLQKHKRPDFFLALAEKFPTAEFVWYGAGEMKNELNALKEEREIDNLFFEEPAAPEKIADEMRASDLFILCADSEGVPKVTQEAAACGLPIVIFGFYEAPTVIDGENGFVVWDDCQFSNKVEALINNRSLARLMGAKGVEMSKDWDWDIVAPLWEEKISNCMNNSKNL